MAPVFDLTLNLAYMYEFQKQKQTNKQTNKQTKNKKNIVKVSPRVIQS